MPIYDLFSRRHKRKYHEGSDVHIYDAVPNVLRGQILHIWDDAVGPCAPDLHPFNNCEAWREFRQLMCREKGLHTLKGKTNPREDCVAYLREEADVAEWLDIVEVVFREVSG